MSKKPMAKSLADWDEEELWEGRRRNARGGFSGRAPATVPVEVHREMLRRKLSWAEHNMAGNLNGAIQVICEIAFDRNNTAGERLKAATYLIDRVMGKPQERIDISQTDAPWQEVIRAAIVGTMEQAKARLPDRVLDVQARTVPSMDEVIE